MKQLILIIILLLNLLNYPLQAQINNYFTYKSPLKHNIAGDSYESLSYALCLNDNGIYELRINISLSEDMLFSITLSSGRYVLNNTHVLKNSPLTFNDSIHGFTMNAYFTEENKLRFTKTPICCMNKSFVPSSYCGQLSTSYFPLKEVIDEERNKFNEKNELNILEPGVYENKKYFWYIKINPDNSYAIKWYDIVISSGTWEREKNILKLKDTTLDTYFYVLIDKDKLVSKLILSDYSSSIFIKPKEGISIGY